MMDTTTLMKSIWMIISYTLYTLKLYIQMTTLFAGFVSVYQESKIWNNTHQQQQQQQHLNNNKNNNNNKDKNDDQEQNLIRCIQPLSLYGSCKVFMLNVVWMSFCLSGSIIILMRHIILLGTTDIAYEANQWIEKTCAKIVTHLFIGRVIVTGIEHLPPPIEQQQEEDPSTTSSSSSSTTKSKSKSKPAPVYIANHTSQVDAAVTYFIDRRYKWIAKQSVMYLPGVGQIMYLSDHIFISRRKGHHHHHQNSNNKHSSSIVSLFEKSNESIQNGMPIFFFPEGTRHIQRTIFKDGAFIVAQTNKSPIIPISIHVPYNVWNSSYPLISTNSTTTNSTTTTTPSDSSCSQKQQKQQEAPIIKITIHPPISVTGEEDREALKKKCGDIIYSVLPTTTSTTTTTTATTIVGEKKKDK